MYLIDPTGKIRHIAVGEGGYDETEDLIRASLPAVTQQTGHQTNYGDRLRLRRAASRQLRMATGYDPDPYERLSRIKHQYDPKNLFRINHNIR
jgi:FAD/FMN-containing dehydrogenase